MLLYTCSVCSFPVFCYYFIFIIIILKGKFINKCFLYLTVVEDPDCPFEVIASLTMKDLTRLLISGFSHVEDYMYFCK